MAQATTGITSDTLKTSLDAVQDQTNASELTMYTYAAKSSVNQSFAQTLGGLAVDAGKAKPQV